MAKEKMYYKKIDKLVEDVEALKMEIEEALGNEKRIINDCKLPDVINIAQTIGTVATTGVGAAGIAGAAGAAYLGPALPLIATMPLSAGLVAWPLIAGVVGAAAIGAVGGGVFKVASKSKKNMELLVEKELQYCYELEALMERLKNQIKLEEKTVEERRKLLMGLYGHTADILNKLISDLRFVEKKKGK